MKSKILLLFIVLFSLVACTSDRNSLENESKFTINNTYTTYEEFLKTYTYENNSENTTQKKGGKKALKNLYSIVVEYNANASFFDKMATRNYFNTLIDGNHGFFNLTEFRQALLSNPNITSVSQNWSVSTGISEYISNNIYFANSIRQIRNGYNDTYQFVINFPNTSIADAIQRNALPYGGLGIDED